MALALNDRVQQTGTANTTVSFTLSGSVPGFQSFAVIGNGNTTYYSATDSSGNWEVGIGTYSTTGPTLTRTTILSSSNSNTAVTFSGVVNVFVTYPAEQSVNLDAAGNVSPLGTVSSGTWQGSTVGVAYGGTGVTTSSGANSVVLRDANQNITANRVNQSNTNTTAAAGTTALTTASSYIQTLVGTGGQTYTMPDATTLTTGVAFVFNNMATGTLTLQNFAAGALGTIAPGGAGAVFLSDNGTVGGTWDVHGYLPEGVTWGTNALNLGTTVISNGTWQGGTIQPAYGGTGLTTFVAANNALYSSGASTLTAGTLPVLAGGTGATTAATARTNLGATTVGSNFFTLTNPSAVTFPRINLDNTVSALSASDFRTAIGAGTSSTTGTVTSVAALTLGTTGTDLSSTVATGTTTPVITLNVPTASAANRGVLSSTDWTTFNNKASTALATATTAGLIELGDATVQTVAANAVTATASRSYALQVNAAGQGIINVPWTDTVYTLPAATTTTLGGIELGDGTVQTVAANAVSATASRTYALQVNAAGQGVINVPWTDTNSGGTVTSVATSGSVNGLTLTGGTITTTGTITLGGSITSVSTSGNFQMNSLGVGTAGSGTAGEIRATNNVTAYYSDERLKTKVGGIENALDKVKQIETMVYHANETAVALGYDASVIEVGVTAQSVQKVMPQTVAPAPIDDKYLTVRYERLVPLLIEAIKELEAQVAELKAK